MRRHDRRRRARRRLRGDRRRAHGLEGRPHRQSARARRQLLVRGAGVGRRRHGARLQPQCPRGRHHGRALRREPVPQPRRQPVPVGRADLREGHERAEHLAVPQHRCAHRRRLRPGRRPGHPLGHRLDHGVGATHRVHEPDLRRRDGRRPRRLPRRRRTPHRPRGAIGVRRTVGARRRRRHHARQHAPLLHEGRRVPGAIRAAGVREGHLEDHHPAEPHHQGGRQRLRLLVDRVRRRARHGAAERGDSRRALVGDLRHLGPHQELGALRRRHDDAGVGRVAARQTRVPAFRRRLRADAE